MDDKRVEMSLGVTVHEGSPVIEMRARPLGDGGPIPKGKILVSRTPILPPGASEEEIAASTREELIDDDGDDAFCPFCAESSGAGRNDPCPCGSGRKFKKCCLAKLERYRNPI